MTETHLYFVRHGETDYNRASIMQGRRIDSSLNDTGRLQAKAVAVRLAEIQVDALYTSALKRARETADVIARSHPEARVHVLEDLEEMSWGVCDGSRPGRAVQAAYERWRAGDFDHAVQGGESILDVQTRAVRALDTILEREIGKRVVVVAHGRFLRVLLATVLEEVGLARMEEIKHANTGVNHIVCADGRYEARLLNCTAHLEDASTAPD